jgi:protein MpaA
VARAARLSALAVVALALLGAGFLSALAVSRAGSSRSHQFGDSVRGRDLIVRRTGSKDAKVEVMVFGVIHGNETAGKPVIERLRGDRPPAPIELWTVMELNPDGVAAHTRQNAHGVDLNRNFPQRWKRQGSAGDTYYSGPSPASEPETRAAMRLIKKVRPDVTIWYHQQMNLVDHSHGADGDLVHRYANVAHMRVDTIPPLPGTATRWQNHHMRRHSAFVVELPAGSLGRKAIRLHAQAVVATGRLAAGS